MKLLGNSCSVLVVTCPLQYELRLYLEMFSLIFVFASLASFRSLTPNQLSASERRNKRNQREEVTRVDPRKGEGGSSDPHFAYRKSFNG